MRYHCTKQNIFFSNYGEIYICNHPVYSRCTLFKINTLGLAVIQQRYDNKTKHTYWGEIDPYLTDILYLHPKFKKYFDERANVCTDEIYPTVAVRQVMWALKMKPIPRERWETVFDRREI